MRREPPLGRFACYHCGHDQYEHNLTEGCPHCRCLATPGEAGTDPKGKWEDLRVRAGSEPPLHDWQRRENEPPRPAPLEQSAEYGLRWDCAANGCAAPCAEDGEVLPRRESSVTERVNGHAVTRVERTVTYGRWRERA